jgi:hypothetical protein
MYSFFSSSTQQSDPTGTLESVGFESPEEHMKRLIVAIS